MIRRSRVKGGTDANEGEFPWMVSIRFNSHRESTHLCGGALIHKRFVVTAAHCMQYKALKYMTIMAGEYDVRGRSNHAQIVRIKSCTLHDKFSKLYINDIAIIELEQPVTWTMYVQPICLPDPSVDAGDNALDLQMMTVAGWGTTDQGGILSWSPKILKKVNVPIVPFDTCQKWFDIDTYPDHLPLSKTTHLCAGYDQGKLDACKGDSGGPLMKIDTNGREVVVGIVSVGRGCGKPQVPGIYTRMVSYIPWIKTILAHRGVTFV